MPPSPDPDERRRRRALAWANHPDLGGDPEAFIAAMEEFESRGGRPRTAPASSADGHPPAEDDVRFVRRPRGLARVPAWFRARRHRRNHPRVT